MEDHVVAGGESPVTALQEETGLIGHREDALLHRLKSDHRIELTDALVEGGGAAGESFEGDIFLLEEHAKVRQHILHHPVEITGPDLLDHETVDVGEGPHGQHALLITLKDGPREAVFHQDVGLHVFLDNVVDERLYKLEGRVGFLFDTAIAEEEVAQRGVDCEELVNLLTAATEPEGQTAMFTAYLVEDLPHDELAVGACQLLQMRQTEHAGIRIVEQLGQWVEGIVACQVEEGGTVGAFRTSVDQHQLLELEQQLLADIIVAGADEQIVAALHLVQFLVLADLVVEYHLTGFHRLAAELGHPGVVGYVLPTLVGLLHAADEHILHPSGLTEARFAECGLHVLIECKRDLDHRGTTAVVNQQDVLAWRPDLVTGNLHRYRPVACAMDTRSFLAVTNGVIGLIVDITLEAVGPEMDLGFGLESDGYGGIPPDTPFAALAYFQRYGGYVVLEIGIFVFHVHHGIGDLVVHLLGEGEVVGLIILVVVGLCVIRGVLKIEVGVNKLPDQSFKFFIVFCFVFLCHK